MRNRSQIQALAESGFALNGSLQKSVFFKMGFVTFPALSGQITNPSRLYCVILIFCLDFISIRDLKFKFIGRPCGTIAICHDLLPLDSHNRGSFFAKGFFFPYKIPCHWS